MIITNATINEVDDIMVIINQAKAYLLSKHINQWQMGYPNEESIMEDITKHHGYILKVKDHIVGYFALSFSDEDAYLHIYDGKWSNNDYYALIHRLCIGDEYKGQGLGSLIIRFVKDEALKHNINQIRIDTHEDNKSMLRLFNKNGFSYAGKVCFRDVEERVAFELIF